MYMQAVYFSVVTVNYVQIMSSSCDWTTRCFNSVSKSKRVNAFYYLHLLLYTIIQERHKSR